MDSAVLCSLYALRQMRDSLFYFMLLFALLESYGTSFLYMYVLCLVAFNSPFVVNKVHLI